MQRFRLLSIALVFVVAISSPALAIKEWTVMVYMAADNNLEPAAINDLNEMETAGSSADVDIVVQIDRIPGFDDTNGDWTTTRRYHILKDSDPAIIGSELIQDLGELNMGDPATLHDFVAWARATYPANHYFLIIWDHGSGWQKSIEGVDELGNLACDKSPENGSPDALSRSRTAEIPAPIPPLPFGRSGFKSAGNDETNRDQLFNFETELALEPFPKLDIVGFDACVMAMIETAYQLKDQADCFIASEESEPGDGWAYDDFLGYMIAQPSYSPAQVCSLVVLTYSNYWSTHPWPLGELEQTLSAISLNDLVQVTDALDALVTQIIGGDSWPELLSMPPAEQFGGDEPYIDLYDYADLISVYVSNPAIGSAANALKLSLSQAVLINRTELGHLYAHGLSIYFPQSLLSLDPRYYNGSVAFAELTSWPSFLLYFMGGGSYVFDFPEPNDVPSQTGLPLDPQYSVHSWVSSLFDNDWYLINGGMDETIAVSLYPPGDADLDLLVYAPDGVTLVASSQNRGTGVVETIDLSGDDYPYFRALVRGYNSFSTSPYQIDCNQAIDRYGWFELSYDDDVPYGGYYSTGVGDVLGSSFSLPTYPMTLDRVWIDFTSLAGDGVGDGTFYLLLFDNYGPIVDPFDIGALTPNQLGWSYLDLSEWRPVVYTDLFVGIWYDGTNTPSVGYDDVSSGRDYYFNWNAGTWEPMSQSLFIRLDASYPCSCPYQCDYDEDGFLTALDMGHMIDVLFFGKVDITDPGCPTTRLDFDLDGFSTPLDLGKLIDHLFYGTGPPLDPCAQ